MYLDTFEGTTPFIGTVRFGRAHRVDKSGTVDDGRLSDWKLGQAFGHPAFALAYYGVGRVATDMLVDSLFSEPGDPLRDLYGLGIGGQFEIRDTNAFHYTGHIDVVVYPGAEGGTREGGRGRVHRRLGRRRSPPQHPRWRRTGFTVGVGLGFRILSV